MKTDSVTEALATFNKAIDAVLKNPPGPKRWRAAHDLLWLNLSSTNRKQYAEVIKENAMARDLVDQHGMGLNLTKVEKADKTMRQALAIPHGAYYTIQRVDPRAFTDEKNRDKMHRTFPEYSTRSTI